MPQRTRIGLLASIVTRIVISGCVLGGALGIFLWLSFTRDELNTDANHTTTQRVMAFAPQTLAVRRQWSGFGTAAAIDDARIPARVASTVIAIAPDMLAGRPIARGELIAALDPADFERQVEVTRESMREIDAQMVRLDVEETAWRERVDLAQADVAIAESDVARVESAAKDLAAQQREVDTARQRLIAAQRALLAAREALDMVPSRRNGLAAMREGVVSSNRLAQLALERCRIESPIDGVLQTVDIKLGESVQPGQQVARVVGLARIEVPLLLPASARPQVGLGDEVLLFEDGAGARSWTALVARVAPEDDPITRTMTLFAELVQDPKSPTALSPGRFVQGSVRASVAVERVMLPRRSVRSDRVMVVRDGAIHERSVTVDFTQSGALPELHLPDLEWVAVGETFSEDELIVLDGARAIPVGTRAEAVRADQLTARAETERGPATDPATDPGADPDAATVAGTGTGTGTGGTAGTITEPRR